MEPVPLQLPPGLFRQGTELQSAGRWYDNQYWRFAEGVIRPMKGWATGLSGTLVGAPIAAHAWLNNNEASFAAFGTATKLYAHNGSALDDITPSGFTSATNWSLDNFGQKLVACNGTTIFEWTPGGGGDATAVTGAPSANAIFVTEERFLISLGINGDPRQFGWPDQETLTTWTPTAINQAGDLPIQATGFLVCGLKIRGSSLLFTTEGLHRLQYLGPPTVYGSEHIANGCGIISQHAKVGVGAAAYWMGRGGFWTYAGYIEQIPCEISDDVFSNINESYRHLCWCEYDPTFGEVWFYYPRGSATSCSHAAIYSTRERHWNHTPMARVAGFGPDVFGWPLRVTSAGAMLKHETGFSYDSEVRKLVSGPVQIGNGGRVMYLDEIWPDEKTQGDCEVYLYVREYPQATETTLGPYAAVDRMGVMTTARQIRFELRMASGKTDARVGDWRALLKSRGRY